MYVYMLYVIPLSCFVVAAIIQVKVNPGQLILLSTVRVPTYLHRRGLSSGAGLPKHRA